jgi:ankyrin repeat protein
VEACPDAAELRDNNDRTFLHAAAWGGHNKVVKLAAEKPTLRGLLNAQDVDGNTPLHLAVAAGASDVVEYLMCDLELRSDVMNKDGQLRWISPRDPPVSSLW